MSPQHPFLENRRSTRVRLQITIEIEGMTETMMWMVRPSSSVVVNKHGALITTARALQVGTKILLYVYLTGKKSGARVVNVSGDNPSH
jgi:hypothetical protein